MLIVVVLSVLGSIHDEVLQAIFILISALIVRVVRFISFVTVGGRLSAKPEMLDYRNRKDYEVNALT